MKRYFWNILVGLTQFLNTLLGGDPDQPFSGRSAIAKGLGKRWGKISVAIIDWIFKKLRNEDDHCFNSIDWGEVDNETKRKLGKL